MKKKIKITLYTICVLWIAAISQLFINGAVQKDDKIIEAFAGTNLDYYESKLSLTAEYGDKYLSEADKKDFVRYVAEGLGIYSDYQIKFERDSNRTETIATKISKNAETTIALISVENKVSNNERVTKQYLLVDLKINQDLNSALAYKSKMEKMLKDLDIKDYDINLYFKGSLSGKKTVKERNVIADSLINNLNMKVTDSTRTENLYTIYGYTRYINNYLEIAGKKVNVNIAMNYDEEKDETVVYLATPILNEDY